LVDFTRGDYDLGADVEYCHKTGRLLAHRTGQLCAELGYYTWINEGQSNGVDLKLWDCEYNLVAVAEILNWGPTTNLSGKRKRDIINNLSDYECNKLLIYTQMGNEYTLGNLECLGISKLKIGYQIVARYFYCRLEADHRVEGRDIDSRETTLHLKTILEEYFQSLRNI
jgi:hypothetical protein